MKNCRWALLALITTLLAWCNFANAVSDDVVRRVHQDMDENCATLFLTGGFKGYQYTMRTKAVFAVGGMEGRKTHCAWAQGTYFESSDVAETKAIEACEKIRPANYGSPCEVYAHDNDIIYISTHARLEKAEKLLQSGDFEATKSALIDIKQRHLSSLSPPIDMGEYEYLFGKVLLSNKNEQSRTEAIEHFHNSWSKQGRFDAAVEAAAEEAALLMEEGHLEKNWKSIRAAYKYFLGQASNEQKAQHPDIEQNMKLTEPYYQSEMALQLEAAKKQAMLDAINAKREAEEEAKQERLDAIKEAEEKRKQERIRKAEEKRIAKEGDGSEDDLTCKKYGAKPGTQIYVDCRIKLGLAKEEAENRNAETVRSERERAEYNRQQQAAQQSAAVQRAAEEDNRRSSAALMAIGGALMGGGVRPQAPVQNQAPQICAYDQYGNKLSCYADYQSCTFAARGIGGQCH